MKKYLFSLLALSCVLFMAKAQVFEDDFESYEDFVIVSPGDWIFYDNDGATDITGFADVNFPNKNEMNSFMVFNPSQTTPPIETLNATYNWDFSPKSGEKYMMAKFCWSVPNSDWLISPQFEVSEDGDWMLNFSAKAPSGYFPNESFNVWISTSDTAIDSFELLDSQIIGIGKEWVDYSYNLNDFKGESIYVGLEYTSNNLLAILFDDFSVSNENLGTSDLNASNMFVYPNPVSTTFQLKGKNPISMNTAELVVKDLNGRTVKKFLAQETYDVSDLPKGVYILEVANGTEKTAIRILKK